MTCTCANEVDDKLASKNTRLNRAWILSFVDEEDKKSSNPNLMLSTSQIETGHGKPKAVSVFFSHCPFCGTKYD